MNAGCHAAWYELNISSADDCVSACCYYRGPKEPWRDQFRPVSDYWNSAEMQTIRRINSGQGKAGNGCEGCYYLGQKGESEPYFSHFLMPRDDLTEGQRRNWERAIDDYENRRLVTESTPLRYYVNFGFACNLSCVMCHQVPRRAANKRQVSADILRQWKTQMVNAIDITVIGGEPFILVEALNFIRTVIEDPDFENVQLTICTNGTLHHKHFDLLRKKRKLQLVVSLDTIGEAYEAIRVNSSWAVVERNIVAFQELGRELGYDWGVQTPCMLLKTNVPKLEDFARWAVEHNTSPGFYDFIVGLGIEETFDHENVIAHPQLVLDVPDWDGCFTRAIAVLQHGGATGAAAQLENLYHQVRQNLERTEADRDAAVLFDESADWRPLLVRSGPEALARLEHSHYGKPRDGRPTREQLGDVTWLHPTDLKDHIATARVSAPRDSARGRWVRVVCDWPEGPVESRCRSYLQDDLYRPLVEVSQRESGLRTERYYRLDDQSSDLRVVFTGHGMESVVLPRAISVGRLATPQDGVLIAAVEDAPARNVAFPPPGPLGRLRERIRARR